MALVASFICGITLAVYIGFLMYQNKYHVLAGLCWSFGVIFGAYMLTLVPS